MKVSRRSFLKTTGVVATGVGGLGIITTVSLRQRRQQAGKPDTKYISILNKRGENGWSTDRWRSELANRGVDFKYKDSRVKLSQNEKGGPTATVEQLEPVAQRPSESKVEGENLPEDIATLELTYANNRINFSWSVNDQWVGGTHSPLDYITLSIDPDQYNWARPEMEMGADVDYSDAVSATGFGYRNCVYDAATASDQSIGRFGSWIDKKLEVLSGTAETRKIYAEYVCRTEEVEAQGMSFSSSGDASITFASETKVWRAETHATEEEMDDGDSYVDPDPR